MPDPRATISLPPDGFSSVRAVQEFAGISRATVYSWMADGRFPQPVKLGPRAVRWRNADLHAWAADPAGWHDNHRDAQHA